MLIALIGTIIPNTTFYISVARLPAGIMSILISTVPLLAFPIALSLGMDRFSRTRLAGLLCGFVGVALIALPQAALPQGAGPLWLAVAMVGPLFYAVEGNIVARWGTAGMDPVQAIFAASVVGMVLVLPLVLLSGQWIDPMAAFGRAEVALVLSSVVNTLMYVGYIWLAAGGGGGLRGAGGLCRDHRRGRLGDAASGRAVQSAGLCGSCDPAGGSGAGAAACEGRHSLIFCKIPA